MNVLRLCRSRRASALLLLTAAMAVTGVLQGEATEIPAETGQEAVAPPQPSGGPLALNDALALAIAYNPRLSVFDLELRVRDALVMQASLRPSPELAFEAENFAGTGDFSGFGGAEYTLALGQLFELGGKRSGRVDVATLDGELAAWDYEAVRLEVMVAVTRAFIDVISAQEELELAGTLVEVAQQDFEAVKRRVGAGATSPVELTRARVSLATATMDRESMTLALTGARARLAATWGSDQPGFDFASGTLDRISSPPGLEDLSKRLEINPDIARWQTELEQRQATLALERALGKIDLMAAGGFRRMEESGDNAFVAGVSLPLPFGDRNQGNVEAAELRIGQVEKERQAEVLAANAALVTIHAELTASYASAITLRDEILPEAQEAMATAESAYLKGLFSYTDVLAIRMTYFELRGRYIESLSRYHIAVSDIERLVAGPLAGDELEQERP
jgi:cobalt-zinc-cadmium efflux system outer membrane protein